MATRYPGLRPDKNKIKTIVAKSITSPACYTMALEAEGKLRGCLIAIVQPHTWAERQVAHIVLWVSEVPSGGVRLLRDFVLWLAPRRGIRLAGYTPDFEWDPRIGKLLIRAGFTRHGGSFLFYN